MDTFERIVKRLEALERWRALEERREGAASGGVLFAQTASATVANTVTETTIVGAGAGSVTLPAGFFTAGKSIRITAMGIKSTTGTPTHRVRVKLGSTTIGDSDTVTVNGAYADLLWEVRSIITCRTVGATGTVFAQSWLHTLADASWQILGEDLESTAATTVDTTGTLAVNITWQWSAASASNTVTCTHLIIEEL